MEYAVTVFSAPSDSRRLRPSSSMSRHMPAARPSTSSGDTSRPLTSGLTISPGPCGQSKLTTGSPQLCASVRTIPNGSKRELSV